MRQCLDPKQHVPLLGLVLSLPNETALEPFWSPESWNVWGTRLRGTNLCGHFPIRFKQAKASHMTATQKEAAWNP